MVSFGPFKSRYLADQEILFRENEESRSLYLIKSGQIRVYTYDNFGAKVLIGMLSANQMVGEMAFIDDSARSAWAEAVGKTEVWEIPTDNLRDMLLRQPAWVRALLQSLVVRLRQSKSTIQELSVQLSSKGIPKSSEEDVK